MYTPENFNRLCEEFRETEAEIMGFKRTEYAAAEDRLENFRTIAEFTGTTMEQVALLYLLKHIQSIAVAVETNNRRWYWGNVDGEGLKQRIADARNYLLLLAGCLDERENHK